MNAPDRPRARLEPLSGGGASADDRRLRAALLLRAGRVPDEVCEPWREAVRAGEFDPDACAEELVAAAPERLPADTLAGASTALLRDLLMAPLAGADRRRGRQRAKSGAALLVSQAWLLLVWGGLALAAVLLVRMRGASIDGFLDGLLGTFH